MKTMRTFCMVFVLSQAFLLPLQATETYTWPFTQSTNYVFDAELIQVKDGEAKLILLADVLLYGDIADVTNGVRRVNLTLGSENSVRLIRDEFLGYQSPGVFVSRVFEGGGGNVWNKITMAASSARYISDPSIELLMQFDNSWVDLVSGDSAARVGSPTFTTNAPQGTHAVFLPAIGSNYATWPNNPLVGANAFTLAIWLNCSQYVGFGGAFTSGGSGAFRLRQRSTSERVLEARISTTAGTIVMQQPLPLDRWVHWAVTWDGSANGDGIPRFYRDGELVNAGLSEIVGTINSGGTVYIGNDYEVPSQRAWRGMIDELLLLDRALSATEVARAYLGKSAIFQSVNLQIRSGTNVAELASRPFTGSDGTPNSTYAAGTSEIAAGAGFNTFDQLVQYKAELRSDKDANRTPYLEGIRFEGSALTLGDNTDFDFALGTLETNVVLFSETGVRPFLGAVKLENGGYNQQSIFHSRTFDAGEPVTWQQLAWQTTQGVADDEFGLISLFHLNGNWNDAAGSHTVFDLANAQFTSIAKLGSRSARFNGVNNVVSGFGSMGTVQTIEFWIRANKPTTPVMSINVGNYIEVNRGRLNWVGSRSSDATIFVNGSEETRHLLSGWNHVAIVLEPGTAISTLVVGEVSGVGFFAGDLDELAFYDRPLLTGEIRGHYSDGERIAGGEVRFQVADSTLTNFVGPGGSPSSYFIVSPFGQDPNLLGSISAQRFFRYKAIMDSDGQTTPKIRSVKVTTAFPHGRTYLDESAQDFAGGEFVKGSTVYGEVLGFDAIGVMGPQNLSPLETGLTGLWHFDDDSWTVGERPVRAAFGSSGFGYGAALPALEPKVGTRSGSFNGTTAFLDSLGTVLPVSDGNFSVSFWFKTKSLNAATLCALDDTVRFFAFRMGSIATGSVSFVVNDGLGEEAVHSSVGALNDNRWHHVVGIRLSNQIVLYVDGEIAGVKEAPGLGVVGIAQDLIVAKDPALNIFFAGFIDELAVFGRALNDADIGALLGGTTRANKQGLIESHVIFREEPSIWQTLAWAPDAPHSKALTWVQDDSDQVGLWHFDGTTGPALNAVLANATLNGVVNGAVRGVSGRFQKAFDFTGANNDYVEIGDDALFVGVPEALSVEAWVFPRSVVNRAIVDKISGGDGFALTTDSGGRPEFFVGGAIAAASIGLRTEAWSHVAGTFDGQFLRLYVNGEIKSLVAAGAGASASGSAMWVGRSRQGRQSFEGAMDEVAYYTRVLGAEEALDHFRSGVASLEFQVRSATNATSFASYVGAGGDQNGFFADHFRQDTQDETDLSKYFQYLARFRSESHYYPPLLHSVSVEASGYPSSNPSINPTLRAGVPFLGHLLDFTHSKFNNPDTDVKYQLSGDAGQTNAWYYYNQDQQKWQKVDAFGPDPYLFQANNVTTVKNNIDTFYTDIYNATGGVFRFRALLHSLGEFQSGLDFVTVEYAVGRIVILRPTGEERGDRRLLIGVPEEVTWDYGGDVSGTVTIQYSTDGGLIWRNMVPPANNIPLTNQLYVWTTPAAATTQALVRVISNTDPTIFDESDQTFELGVGYTIVENNGGVDWYIGETNIIIWKKSFQIGAAHLEFSLDGNFSSNNTVRITPVTVGPFPLNQFTWYTPMTNAHLISTEGKLRAINALRTQNDESDRPFQMKGAVVTSPATGEAVKKDADYNLKWRSAGMGEFIKLEIQLAPAGPWILIDEEVPNTDGNNVYLWFPTNAPTDDARLRLTSTNDVRARGLTDVFKIAAIELTNPLGHPDLAFSDVWLQATTQTISWISGGAADTVNVLFSIDGGANYMMIASNYPNVNAVDVTNEYVWIVRPFPTDRARIRIEDAVRPAELSSVTPFDFQIAGLRVDWPNGGDEWPLGQRLDVQWIQNALGIEGIVEISYDNKVNWSTIIEGFILQNNSASYVPTNPSLSAFVRVTANNPPAFTNRIFTDTSDARFSVAGIEILAPKLEDEYTIGSTHPITFRIAATYDNNNAAEYYYSSSGANFNYNRRLNSDTDVFQDGTVHTFDWLIDEDRRPSFSAQLQVAAGDYRSNSKLFTLRGVRFESPVSAETVKPGTYNIAWSHAGLDLLARVKLSMSVNGRSGPFDTVVATNIFLTDELFSWVVPEDVGPSTNAAFKIEITEATGEPLDLGYTAVSRTFKIQGIRVITPGTGDQPEHGGSQSIVWSAASGGDVVDVYYSSDGGLTEDSDPVSVFVPSADGNNAISWDVELFRAPSTNAVIRVASQSFAGVDDLSDPFMLQGILVTRPTSFDIYSTDDVSSPISWIGVNASGPVNYNIYYLKDGSTNQVLIANNESGPQYNWSIPPGAVSDNIRIVVTDGKFSNTSAVFRVVDQATVDVSSPSPNQFLQVSRSHLVQWLKGGNMTNDFTLSYSTSPFNSTNLIASGAEITFNPAQNAFEALWKVPDSLGATRLIVQHNSLPAVRDVSETFNIVGIFDLLTPTNGISVFALRPGEPVIWQTLGNVKFVDLYYSISQQHEADSWIKVNDTPIANNSKVYTDNGSNDDWVRSSYPWTVANARTTRAKLRIQEAAYPQKYNLNFKGPFANSYGEFSIIYYSVYWDVYDAATQQRLDFVSVVDSSGWAASDLSSIAPNFIKNDYAWGSYNTEIYRAGFFDNSILFWDAENRDIAVPGPQSWTQSVAMTRSLISPDAKVLANFSYDSTLRKFTIHSWIERAGHIIETPTSSLVTVFDADGDSVASLPHDVFLANGIFLTEWVVPEELDNRNVFFAKVEVVLSGVTYSSGLTFTLLVPVGEEILPVLDKIVSNLNAEISGNLGTNLGEIASLLGAYDARTQAGLTNLHRLGQFTTGQLARVQSDLSVVTNDLKVLLPIVDNIASNVIVIADDVKVAVARILSRPESVAFGSTNSLLYRTQANYDPGQVTYQVLNAANGQVASGVMTEIIPGIYEASYVANWGVNRYKIQAVDPKASDAILVRVVTYDPLEVPNMIAAVTNELDLLEARVMGLATVNSSLTNLFRELDQINVDLLATAINVSSLTNSLMGVDFSKVQSNIENLTNDLSVLANLDSIATQVSSLTNSVRIISGLTNLSSQVAALTNAIGDFSVQTVHDIQKDLRALTNRLAVINWDQINTIEQEVSGITNTINSLDAISFQLDSITNSLAGVNFLQLAGSVYSLTNSIEQLGGVADQLVALTNSLGTDFARLADQLNGVSNSLAGLDVMTSKLNFLTNSIGSISFSLLARNVENLTNAILRVDFDGLANSVDSMTNIFPGLAGISSQINEITNTLFGVNLAEMQTGVASITGIVYRLGAVGSQVDTIYTLTKDARFGDVDFELLASQIVSISNILSGVSGLEGIAAEIGALSNSISQISALTNLTGTVTALGNKLLDVDFDQLIADSQFTTNILGSLDQLTTLSSQLSGLSSSVTALASITNLSSKVDLMYTRLNVDVDFAQLNKDISNVTNTLANLAGLQSIGGQLSGLSSSVVALAAVTNISTKVDDLATALLVNQDYRNLFRDLSTITNQLNDLTGLAELTAQISNLSTSVTALAGVTNIESQVTDIFNQVRNIDFAAMQIGIGAISNKLVDLDWGDVTALGLDVQYLTNQFSAVQNLERVAEELSALTNAIAQLSGVTNIGAEVANITNALNGLDWSDILAIRGMVQGITNELQSLDALSDINQIVATLSDVTNAVAKLDGLTNMPTQIDAMSLNLANISFLKLREDVSSLTNTIAVINWDDILDIQTEVLNITNTLGSLPDLPALIAQITSLTNSFNDLQSITNVTRSIDGIVAAIGTVRFEDLASNVQVLTNEIANLNLDILSDLRTDVSEVTNLLQTADLGRLQSINAGVSDITNTLARVNFLLLEEIYEDTSFMTNLTSELQALVASVNPLLNITNSIAQLSGVTNIGAEVANITNALRGLNWPDVTEIRDIVRSITNDLALLENLRGFDPGDLTNTFGAFAGDLTNVSAQVDSILNVVKDFNWDTLSKASADVAGITNSLTQLTGLQDVAETLKGLTNAIYSLSGVTNIGAEVSNITNALAGLDWSDVLDIQTKVNSITNTLGALANIDQLSTLMRGLTNSLADMSSVTNLEAKISLVQRSVTNIVWADIGRIAKAVDALTNDLQAVTGLGSSLTNLTGSLDSLAGVTNLNKSVNDLATTFAAAKWSDVTGIQSSLSTLSQSLGGLNGVNLASLDATSLTRIEQQLARMQADGSSSVLRDIEKLLGSSSSGGESILSRLDAISRKLNIIGSDASDASTKAQSAKTKASSAAGSASAAQQAIERGDLDQAMAAIRQVLSDLRAAQHDLREIPQDGENSIIFKRVRSMADIIEKWAKNFDYVYPSKFQGKGGAPAEGDEGAPGGEQISVEDLSASIQEMRISMEFLRKMIEEVAYEPVVEEALLAVE